MQTARLFSNGRSQAVRLPKECQFKGEDVYIQKIGDAVILFPLDKAWETFLHGLHSFSDDYLSEARDQGQNQARRSVNFNNNIGGTNNVKEFERIKELKIENWI